MVTSSFIETEVFDTLSQQYRHLDNRPLQTLGKVITVEELRRQRLQQTEKALATKSTHFRQPPNFIKRLNEQDKSFKDPVASAFITAQEQVRLKQPALYERIEKTLDYLQVSKENRSHRLNALGVFSPEINEVRCRSMYRVELQQELSAKALRVPQKLKEIKPVNQDMSVVARLERLYNRIVKSIEEPRSLQGKSMDRHHRAPMVLPPMVSIDRDYRRSVSGYMAGGGGSVPGSPAFGHRHGLGGMSTAGRATSGSRPPSTVHKNATSFKSTWNRIVMSPEAAEVHLETLRASTMRHLQRYRDRVNAAQRRMMESAGLDGRMVTPQTLLRELQSQDRRNLGLRFSKQQHSIEVASTTTAEVIAAALAKIEEAESELAQLRPPDDSSVHLDKVELPVSRGEGSAEGQRPTSGTEAQGVPEGSAESQLQPQERSFVYIPAGFKALTVAQTAAGTPNSNLSPVPLSPLRSPVPSPHIDPTIWPVPDEVLPPLPQLPAGSEAVQARLARVWDVLEMPHPTRFDLVLKVTARSKVSQMDAVLEAWELAAAAVVQRENALGHMLELQSSALAFFSAGSAPRENLSETISLSASSNRSGSYTPFDEEAAAEIGSEGVDMGEVEGACEAFVEAGLVVEAAARNLKAMTGMDLTYMGEPYPGQDALDHEDVLGFIGGLQELVTGAATMSSDY